MNDKNPSPFFARAKNLFGSTARLAQKKAALAKLNSIALSKVYYSIGRSLMGQGDIPLELAEHRQKILSLESKIAESSANAEMESNGRIAEMAKGLTKQAVRVTSNAAVTAQIHAAYMSLGKAAVTAFGDRLVPAEILPEFQRIRKEIDELKEEIGDLGSAAHSSFNAQKKFFVSAGLCILLVVGVVVLWPASPEVRQWTTRSGKVLGTGSFMGLDGEHVRIQLSSGKVGRIAKNMLSEEDIRFVENTSDTVAESEKLVIEEEGTGTVAAQPLVHSPPAGPSRMLVATRAAWRGLQEADSKTNKTEFSLLSERCRATAFAYSQIPLADADPVLIRHVQRSMEAQKAAALVCLRYESEMKDIQSRVDNAAGVGAFIGGAASEPGAAQANAAGLALLFGGLAQASATSESKAAFAKMQAAWKNVESELNACAAGDIEVSKYLTEKYGEPFLDAF